MGYMRIFSNIPKAIFYLLKGDYKFLGFRVYSPGLELQLCCVPYGSAMLCALQEDRKRRASRNRSLQIGSSDAWLIELVGSFPLTVTVTTMGYRSYKNPLNKAPLRTVTGRGNDPNIYIYNPNRKPTIIVVSIFFSSIPIYPL